jgi:hypothetical protein
MLSWSMREKGEKLDFGSVLSDADNIDDRVPHGKTLARFAEAVLQGSDDELAQARDATIAAVGNDGFVDAAGVVGTFERMTRLADCTGVPLDDLILDGSEDIREGLGVNDFTGAEISLGQG